MRPLFIFGVARSGTNLVGRMLDAHPAVTVALDPLLPLFKTWRNLVTNELSGQLPCAVDPAAPFQDFYFFPGGKLLLDGMLEADADAPIGEAEQASLTRDAKARASLESDESGQLFSDWDGRTVRERVQNALDRIARLGAARGKANIAWSGTKEVWTTEFVRPLARCFPDARFILLHRDPRAIVASLVAMMVKDPSQAAHVVSYMRHWRKHAAVSLELAADPLLSGRILEVRYEQIVAEPERHAKRFTSFLDLTFDEAMLRPGGEGWHGNSSYTDTVRGIDAGFAERWRKDLDAGLAAAVEFHCGPEMTVLGYHGARKQPSPEAVGAVMHAHANPGKWRSDSGDAVADLAWECLRWQLLDWPAPPEDMIRRCYLFTTMYEAARNASRLSRSQYGAA